MRRAVCRIALALLGAVAACAESPQVDGTSFSALSEAQKTALRKLAPPSLPAPLPDSTNRFADDPVAARLGQRLFMDPGFSGALTDGSNDGSTGTLGHIGETGKVACASCHIPHDYFVDTRTIGAQISLAAGWSIRRTRSLLDVGQATLFMWDGHRDALYNQIFTPLEDPNEMNSSRLYISREIWKRYRHEYEALFGSLPPFEDTQRFPEIAPTNAGCPHRRPGEPLECHGLPGDGAEFDHMAPEDQAAVTRVVVNMGKAIGAYERRLSCGTGRFDAWVNGEEGALSASEVRGAQLFIGKARCTQCHKGPFFSDQTFHNVGLSPEIVVTFQDIDDPGASVGLQRSIDSDLNSRSAYSDGYDGRLPDAVLPGHEGAFRTPSLRCVSRRPSFTHTGQLRSLEEVVAFKSRGGHPYGYPGRSELGRLDLTASDQSDLVAFLRTLEGLGPGADLQLP